MNDKGLKIYHFRNQFTLTDLERMDIEDICLFINNICVWNYLSRQMDGKSLEIYHFRDKFSLTGLETKAIEDICFFIINIYVQAWFNAVSGKPLSKIINHLWYFNS